MASPRLTFAVLAVAAAAYSMLQSSVIPVLATLQAAFHTTQSAATWILTGCLLSASVLTPIVGRIGDLLGRRRVLVATLVVLAIGTALSAFADSIGVMIFARVVQGIGGGILPLAFGIIRDEFPPGRVAGSVGAIASLTAVGAALGVVLTGPIVEHLGFRWLFLLPVIIIGLAAIAAWLVVPDSPPRVERGVGWIPAIFLSTWLVALLLAVSFGPAYGWLSAPVLGLFAVTVAGSLGWIAAESRVARPLVDLRLMRTTIVWTTNLVALLVGVGLFATFGFLPQLVQTPTELGYGFGATVAQSGLLVLPSCVTQVAVGLLATRLDRRLGGKTVVIAGCVCSTASMVVVAFAHDQLWTLYLASAVLGAGVGLSLSGLAGLIVTAVPAEQTGVASGMNANIRLIGGSVGAALVASIVASSADPAGLPAEWGYTAGFAVLAGTYLLAGLAALLIPIASVTRPAT